MDISVPIDVDLITKITGLPIDWVKPEKYLDDNKKETTILEEVKSQFGTDRGSKGMIIKNINDPATRFATKLMDCKLLRKCHKEEAPSRVVSTVMQCMEGTILSWAPYLLNIFLEDCRDEHDYGIEFQYSWLLILTALVAWEEPKYSAFYDRRGNCRETRYITLWHKEDPK
jgi:hypothetical protein